MVSSDAPEAKAPTEANRLRLLIADDEASIANTLKLVLAQEGFRVIAVFGGQAAVQVAPEWRPDLFLSDVMMPDLNGIEAAIQITQQLPECKVLLLSGHGAVRDLVSEARRRGYDFPVLSKPIHPTELIERIKEALG